MFRQNSTVITLALILAMQGCDKKQMDVFKNLSNKQQENSPEVPAPAAEVAPIEAPVDVPSEAPIAEEPVAQETQNLAPAEEVSLEVPIAVTPEVVEEEVPVPSVASPTRTAIQNILLVGDSQLVGPFGRLMKTALSSFYNVCARGEWGSVPTDFVNPERELKGHYRDCAHLGAVQTVVPTALTRGHIPQSLRSITQNFKPDLFIIELGGNLLGINQTAESIEAQIKAIILETKNINNNAQCVWIGPINGAHRHINQIERFYSTLYRIAATDEFNCHVYDSRWFYVPMIADGTHLNYITPITLLNSRECVNAQVRPIAPLSNFTTASQHLDQGLSSLRPNPFEATSCRTGDMMGVHWALDVLSYLKITHELNFNREYLATSYSNAIRAFNSDAGVRVYNFLHGDRPLRITGPTFNEILQYIRQKYDMDGRAVASSKSKKSVPAKSKVNTSK